MSKHGKQYNAQRAKIDFETKYTLDEAIKLVKDATFAKFDESIDVAFRLGVNPKYADQMVRGALLLPNGTGKDVKVLVFAKGDKETEAKEAGADFVGGEDMVEKIKGGWFGFDSVVASPDMMGQVGKIGKLLGPRGLMPNPKVGTVTKDVGRVVSELKKGRVEFRVEKAGIIHAPVGRKSFDADKLKENVMELAAMIIKMKPSSVKGTYLKGLAISSTMGPSVRIDPNDIAESLS